MLASLDRQILALPGGAIPAAHLIVLPPLLKTGSL